MPATNGHMPATRNQEATLPWIKEVRVMKTARDLMLKECMRKLSLLALLALGISSGAVAQTPADGHPTSDAAKLADALRAAPPFITKGATIVDWPTTPTGEYRVLRAGTTDWTCLPASPLYPHDEPGCFDATFFKWIKDSTAGEKAPHVDKVASRICTTVLGSLTSRETLLKAPITLFTSGRIS